MAGDTITLHMCNINENHIMYGSWDMEHDEENFMSFWTIFCRFTPLKTQKLKILKNWKECLEISSFYTSVPKIMIICYTVLGTWHVTGVIVIFHFGLFFTFLTVQKLKFHKNENNSWRYHHFTHVYQKLWFDDVWSLRYGARQIDRWKKWHIEVGAPRKKMQ